VDISSVLQLASQLGSPGLFFGYFIWNEMRRDKLAAAERAERAEREDRDIASREKLAGTLATLAAVIGAGKVNV
jgi:hypothetical protein